MSALQLYAVQFAELPCGFHGIDTGLVLDRSEFFLARDFIGKAGVKLSDQIDSQLLELIAIGLFRLYELTSRIHIRDFFLYYMYGELIIDDALEVFYEIEAACALPFTAIVNNTNLGPLTKAEDVIAGERFAEEVAKRVELPVKMSCASEKLSNELQDKVSNFFPIQIMQLYYMEKEGTSLGKINL